MTYFPDEQDDLMAEAEALGGRAYAQMVQIGASIEACELVPWDGTGDEPPERREAWLWAARSMIDARWALLHRGPYSDC